MAIGMHVIVGLFDCDGCLETVLVSTLVPLPRYFHPHLVLSVFFNKSAGNEGTVMASFDNTVNAE